MKRNSTLISDVDNGGATMCEMLNWGHMKSTLDEAVEQAKTLPESFQQELVDVILALVGKDCQMPVITY